MQELQMIYRIIATRYQIGNILPDTRFERISGTFLIETKEEKNNERDCFQTFKDKDMLKDQRQVS